MKHLKKLLPRTLREAAFLAVGMTTILGGYAAYQQVESTYPSKLKPILSRLFGKSDPPCNGRQIPSTIDLEEADVTLDDIVSQAIFTTYSGDHSLSTGFMYLTPADTSRLEEGEIVFIPQEAKRRICSSKAPNVIPTFVGDEGEGGYVTRIELRLPPAEVLGQYYEGQDTPELQRYPSLLSADGKMPDQKTRQENIAKLFQSAALTLKNMHLDYVFAPVIDTVRDIHNKENLMSANDRSYSSNPQTVVALAKMYIDAMHQQKIKVIAKHYLGTGYTSVDPHKGLPSLEGVTSQELSTAWEPFVALKNDLDGIMVTHIVNPQTGLPDSVSPAAYQHLRQELGFKGIIIADDLYMGAIEEMYSENDEWIVAASLDALLAGADGVIVKHPDQVDAIKTAIAGRMKDDAVFRQNVMDSFTRLLHFKSMNVVSADARIVVTGKTTSEGEHWIKRRIKQGETFIELIAQEDSAIVSYNGKGNPYVTNSTKYQKLVEGFTRLNSVSPRQLKAGFVYYFPDLSNDGVIATTKNFPPAEKHPEPTSALLEAAIPRGHSFAWYLAGELGREVVDSESGYLLPVTSGPLQEHYDRFRTDNPQVTNFRRMKAGDRFHFRDLNRNGRVDFKDPVALVRQYHRGRR